MKAKIRTRKRSPPIKDHARQLPAPVVFSEHGQIDDDDPLAKYDEETLGGLLFPEEASRATTTPTLKDKKLFELSCNIVK